MKFLKYEIYFNGMGIGDWGLAQSPIPNPHPIFLMIFDILEVNYNFKIKIFSLIYTLIKNKN